MTNNTERECDVLVIGSGAAGLTLALKLADESSAKALSKKDQHRKHRAGSPLFAMYTLIMTVWNPMLQIHWLQEPGYAKRTL